MAYVLKEVGTPMTQEEFDDRMAAAVDLIGRCGATDLEVGFLHDDVPMEEADWWAAAHFRGARVTVEHKKNPGHAVDSLLVRLLDGARCAHCGKYVTNRKSVSGRKYCKFIREGERFQRGCEVHDGS